MWIKGNKINIDNLIAQDFFLIKFDCGLCLIETELHFSGYSNDFFNKNPKHVIELSLECPECSNWHEINISSRNKKIIIDIECELVSKEYQTEIDSETIHYSLSLADNTKFSIEYPLELDRVDEIIGNDFVGNYKKSIQEIKEVIKTNEVINNPILRKLIYSNVITIFETYLSDLIINTVHSSTALQTKVVENYGIFDNEKIDLKNIYSTMSNLEREIITRLRSITYHNLNKVIPLYSKVLGINFSGVIGKLPKAITIRHDIVHRNGKTIDGESHAISIQIINDLILNVEAVSTYIDLEIKNKSSSGKQKI